MGFFKKLLGLTETKPPLSLNDDNFEAEVLRSELPVLLDVWGTSCGPCKKLEPIVMALAAQYDGRVKVCELAAQSSPRAMAFLQVQATPTILYFQGGRELERIHGFRSSLFHQQTIHELFGIEQ
jgi:thioredoxin 1